MRYGPEADLIESLGGPGRHVGYGFTQDQAIQLAIATQLARMNGLLASGCQLAETIAGHALASPVAQAVEVERKAIENACAYLEADAGVWEEMAEKSHHREYASAAARLRREAAAAIRTPDPIASQTEGEGE